jgi:hypothetical protein
LLVAVAVAVVAHKQQFSVGQEAVAVVELVVALVGYADVPVLVQIALPLAAPELRLLAGLVELALLLDIDPLPPEVMAALEVLLAQQVLQALDQQTEPMLAMLEVLQDMR